MTAGPAPTTPDVPAAGAPASGTPDLPRTLLIACGALAPEILALKRLNSWDHLDITCLPAIWHNYPDRIVPGVLQKIDDNRKAYTHIKVVYADCGTGGGLDAALDGTGVERIPGPHCYSFFTGAADFDALAEEELGTFYLTDYLARFFDRLIWRDFGIEQNPELRDMLFGNYKRLVYLAQQPTDELRAKAQDAAAKIGLEYEERLTGFGELSDFMAAPASPHNAPALPESFKNRNRDHATADNHVLAGHAGSGRREAGTQKRKGRARRTV